MVSEAEDEECSDMLWRGRSDLKEALQLANDVVSHFSEISCFMDRCLIFKHEMETLIAPYKDIHKDMQKMIQSSSRLLSPTPPHTLNCSVTVVPCSQKF